MKSFPKPLTPEEEALFLQKYKEGDLEAKKILIERNLRLVAHVAKKYQIEGETIDVIERMELDQNTQKLYGLLENVLSEREKEILKLRYGLYGKSEMTQREIADKMGISRSYVSRIEKSAVAKLRQHFQISQA